MKTKFPIIENAKRQARMIFKGIAIPMLVEIPDDKAVEDTDYVYGVADHKRYLVTEKVLKFNRKALRRLDKVAFEKTDPRLVGKQDNMRFKVGKPGSPERVVALAAQYASLAEDEMSPFFDEEIENASSLA